MDSKFKKTTEVSAEFDLTGALIVVLLFAIYWGGIEWGLRHYPETPPLQIYLTATIISIILFVVAGKSAGESASEGCSTSAIFVILSSIAMAFGHFIWFRLMAEIFHLNTVWSMIFFCLILLGLSYLLLSSSDDEDSDESNEEDENTEGEDEEETEE